MKHVIRTQQFSREALKKLFALTNDMEFVRDDSLKGRIMATLFYEPSTRTRFSFESAMLRLGGGILSAENAKEFSSASKGESIHDTVRVVGKYADLLVIRHPEAGTSERAAEVAEVPIVNGGDGAGQHPTQALVDLYTIERELGRADGVHVAIVGDLKYGRAARSLAYLLGKYNDVKITFVSSPELRVGDDIKEYLSRHNVAYRETEDMDEVVREADALYQTRVQKERFEHPEEYERFKDRYIINRAVADSMKEGAILIHPLPRVGEITADVDSSPHAVYFRQVAYGVYVRMALLTLIFKGEEYEDE